MGSIAPTLVAQDVLESVRKGKRPNLGKIILKRGYALTTSTVPSQVTNTKAYKKVVLPYAERLQKHQEKILKAMEAKDLSVEEYKTLSDSLTKITHDVQILTGGSTENVKTALLVKFIDAKDNGNTAGV